MLGDKLVKVRIEKERERYALELVYSRADFEYILHDDSPDFVLRRHGFRPFGIDVTDLYQHEADARANAHATYVSDLLDGGDGTDTCYGEENATSCEL